MSELNKPEMEIKVLNNKICITKMVTSQSETRQVAPYTPNSYFTSAEVQVPEGIPITDKNGLKQLLQAVTVANALCTHNNRKGQIRDGVIPIIASNLKDVITNNSNGKNLDIDKSTVSHIKEEDIIDPKDFGAYLNKVIDNFTKITNLIATKAGITPDTTSINSEVEKIAKQKSCSIKQEAKINEPKKRSNPKRAAKVNKPTVVDQEIVQ